MAVALVRFSNLTVTRCGAFMEVTNWELAVIIWEIAVAFLFVLTNWSLVALTNLFMFALAPTLVNRLASTIHWIWLLDISCLHNWDIAFPVNWNLDRNSLHCFAVNWLVTLNDLGDDWTNFFLNNHFLVDVVWNVLLHVHWDLYGNFDGNMYWYTDSFADGHSLSDFNDVWDLAASGDWNLFNNIFIGASVTDVTLVDFGADFTMGFANWSLMATTFHLLVLALALALALAHWSTIVGAMSSPKIIKTDSNIRAS